MAHIIVNGTDMDRSIQYINIHAEIRFSREFFYSKGREEKISELEDKISKLISEYFDDVSCESMSNQEFRVYSFQVE